MKAKDADLKERLGIGLKEDFAMMRYWQLYNLYKNRLESISVTAFDWKGLPNEIDISIMETLLLDYGKVAVVYDDVLEQYFTFPVMQIREYDPYGRPLEFVARSLYRNISFYCNRYTTPIIYDTPCSSLSIKSTIRMYAERLALARMTMDSNMNTLRTPYLLKARNSKILLSLKNMYKKIKNFEDEIMIEAEDDKSMLSDSVSVLNLGIDKVFEFLRTTREEYNQLWNEALSAIGIPNIAGMKKERMIQDEVNRETAGAIASQYPRIQPRLQGCLEMSRCYTFNADVSYREGFAENVRKAGDLSDGEIYNAIA